MTHGLDRTEVSFTGVREERGWRISHKKKAWLYIRVFCGRFWVMK